MTSHDPCPSVSQRVPDAPVMRVPSYRGRAHGTHVGRGGVGTHFGTHLRAENDSRLPGNSRLADDRGREGVCEYVVAVNYAESSTAGRAGTRKEPRDPARGRPPTPRSAHHNEVLAISPNHCF